MFSPQQASKLLPLVTNMDAYEAFKELLEIIHKNAYEAVKNASAKEEAVGQLKLIDELKELKERLKDSVKNGRN